MPGSSERLRYIEQDDDAKDLLERLGVACSRLPLGSLDEVVSSPGNVVRIVKSPTSGITCYLVEEGTRPEDTTVKAKEILTITFGKMIFNIDLFRRENEKLELNRTVLYAAENHEMIHPWFIDVLKTYAQALRVSSAAQ